MLFVQKTQATDEIIFNEAIRHKTLSKLQKLTEEINIQICVN